MLATLHDFLAIRKEATCICLVLAGLAPDVPHQADGGTADAARDGAVSTPGAEPCHGSCQLALEAGHMGLGGCQVSMAHQSPPLTPCQTPLTPVWRIYEPGNAAARCLARSAAPPGPERVAVSTMSKRQKEINNLSTTSRSSTLVVTCAPFRASRNTIEPPKSLTWNAGAS